MRPWTSLLIFGAGFGVGLVVEKGLAVVRMQTSQTSLSPDDQYRVRILDRALPSVDRNFEVRVERRDGGRETTVFQSPDEAPIGRERIVWSEDGTRFVVLGRGFFVRDRPKSDDEEVLYLMVEVASGKVWCNSRQQTAYPPFACKDLPPMRWGGPCPTAGPARDRDHPPNR